MQSWGQVESTPNGKLPFIEEMARDAIGLWLQKRPNYGRGYTPDSNTTRVPSKRSASGTVRPSQSPLSIAQPLIPGPASRTKSGSPRGGEEHSPTRNVSMADQAKERDRHTCVASHTGWVDACHIYPSCAFDGQKDQRVERLWKYLRMMWGKEKAKAWRDCVFRDQRRPDRGCETLKNLISFTSSLARAHSHCDFALRPVMKTEDGKELVLEFHWLPVSNMTPESRVNLLERPETTRGRYVGGKGKHPFADHRDPLHRRPIISGHQITMKTEDPKRLPLPGFGLLEMQWHLQRIAAMSGAVDWDDRDFEREFDDGSDWW